MDDEKNEYNLENRLKSEFNLGPEDLAIIQEATLNKEKNEVSGKKEKKVIEKVQNVRKILSTVSNEMSDIVTVLHGSKQQIKQERVQYYRIVKKVLKNFVRPCSKGLKQSWSFFDLLS